MKAININKIFAFSLLTMIAFSFVACGKSTSVDESETTSIYTDDYMGKGDNAEQEENVEHEHNARDDSGRTVENGGYGGYVIDEALYEWYIGSWYNADSDALFVILPDYTWSMNCYSTGDYIGGTVNFYKDSVKLIDETDQNAYCSLYLRGDSLFDEQGIEYTKYEDTSNEQETGDTATDPVTPSENTILIQSGAYYLEGDANTVEYIKIDGNTFIHCQITDAIITVYEEGFYVNSDGNGNYIFKANSPEEVTFTATLSDTGILLVDGTNQYILKE